MCRFQKLLLVALAGVSLLTLIVTEGCSKNKEEPPRATVEVPAEQPTTEGMDEAGSTGSEPHQLMPCKWHRYTIAPGESATVTFETEVKSDVAKAAMEGEPTVNKQAMEAAGYSVSYSSRSVDTFSRSRPVWTVFNSDFAATEKEIVYETTTAGVSIRWKTDGSGVIERIGDVRGPFDVGKLTSQDLTNKLGRDTVWMVGRGNKTYNLSPSQGSMDEEINILSVTLNITVPRDKDKVMQEKIGGVFWKGGGITFRGNYNITNLKKYVIAGPAKSRECFDQ